MTYIFDIIFIVFKGFINGIPTDVLTGGRYDNLAARMGKHMGAIGFAVYLDALERLDLAEKTFDVDVVLAASHDTASAVMAVPSNDENVMYISSGTWSLMGIETKVPFNSEECRKFNIGAKLLNHLCLLVKRSKVCCTGYVDA